MPDSQNWAGAPIPLGSEANRPNQWMKDYHAAIDPQLNLRATDVADRNARYGPASQQPVPPGTLVTRADGLVTWVKTITDWAIVHQQTEWTTSGITAASGFSLDRAEWAVTGGLLNWAARVTRTADPIGANPAGSANIPDTRCILLGTQLRPHAAEVGRYRTTRTGGNTTISGGDVFLVDIYPSTSIEISDYIDLSFTYRFEGVL